MFHVRNLRSEVLEHEFLVWALELSGRGLAHHQVGGSRERGRHSELWHVGLRLILSQTVRSFCCFVLYFEFWFFFSLVLMCSPSWPWTFKLEALAQPVQDWEYRFVPTRPAVSPKQARSPLSGPRQEEPVLFPVPLRYFKNGWLCSPGWPQLQDNPLASDSQIQKL